MFVLRNANARLHPCKYEYRLSIHTVISCILSRLTLDGWGISKILSPAYPQQHFWG